MRKFKIKEWEKFQHYKDRNPPWVKLHFEIMSSRCWVTVDDNSKLLMVICTMLASRNDGVVTEDSQYIQLVAHLKAVPDFKPLVDCGFLIPMLADASNLQADAIIEKRREEKRREKKEIDKSISKKENASNVLALASTPTLDEVIAYAESRGNVVDPKIFYDYYSESDWRDSNGKLIANWKQKFIVWENHKPAEKKEKPKQSTIDFEATNGFNII